MAPKKDRKRLQVIRVPLDYLPVIHPPNFPSMPRLYMELLENKNKVKPELRNKEYIPTSSTTTMQSPTLGEAETKINIAETLRVDGDEKNTVIEPKKENVKSTKATKKPKKGPLEIIDVSKMTENEISDLAKKKTNSSKPLLDFSDSKKEKEMEKEQIDPLILTGAFPRAGPILDSQYRNSIRMEENRSKSASPFKKESSFPFPRDRNIHRNGEDKSYKIDRYDKKDDTREYDDEKRDYRKSHDKDDYERNHRKKDDNDDYEHRHRKNRDEDDRENRHRKHRDEGYDRNDNHSDRHNEERYEDKKKDNISSIISPDSSTATLEDILAGKTSNSPKEEKETITHKSSSSSTSSSSSGAFPKIAPSYDDIRSGKAQTDSATGLRDIEYVTKDEEAEAGKKRDILFKFKILKRTYKETTIPEFSEHTDLKVLEREYDSTVRQLSLDATVENYRKYLTIGFYVLEFVLINFFKFEEIRGFSQQQMLGMNQYERILFAIGEKQYFSGKKSWPPEVQLIGIIVLNGAIFVGSKMLFKSTGANILNILNQNSGGGSTPQQAQPVGGKTRMRAPDIDLNNLTGKKSS